MTRTTDLSRIYASTPLNKTAGVVVSKGINFDDETRKPETVAHWVAPPRVVDPSRHPKTNGFVDLTGTRFGRMVVVGLLPPEFTGQNGAMWLCRCVCGDYEPRRSKAIKANLDPEHCCEECRYTLRLKWRASGAGQ